MTKPNVQFFSRSPFAGWAVCAALFAAGVFAGMTISAPGVYAQSKGSGGKIPRTSDGKPDFSGIFEWPKSADGEKCKCSATVFDRKYFAPFKPGGEKLFIEPHNGVPFHDEPRNFCMPAGFPGNMLSANALQMVQNKGYLSIVHEFMRTVRLVPLDGRKHRDGIEPTFFGDPVGHWEGDTLVIDSTNFKRWTLDDYYYSDPNQYRMHSDAFHTIERMAWKDAENVSYNLTIDDPKIFTRPWSQEFSMALHNDWDKDGLYEYVCEENNRCPGGHCGGDGKSK